MLKKMLAFGVVMIGTVAQADDWRVAEDVYNESYLQIEACFQIDASLREECVIAGIKDCVTDLGAALEDKGLVVPRGAGVSPDEFCNYIGEERADRHLNAMYQRIMKQGAARPDDKSAIAQLRTAQRLWLQFANEMCSEENIVGWHAGGSDWGAVTSECTTRLSIQQAGHLERFFTIND